jgi:hypothetical protein
MGTEIKVVQACQINHDIADFAEQLKIAIDELNAESIAAVASNLKYLKETRAAQNKYRKEFEDRLKEVIEEASKPIANLKTVAKEKVLSNFDILDKTLKDKIETVELAMRENILAELKAHFELINTLEWLDFASIGIKVTLSGSINKWKDEISAFVDKVQAASDVIEKFPNSEKLMEVYKETLDLRSAMEIVAEMSLPDQEINLAIIDKPNKIALLVNFLNANSIYYRNIE